MPDADQPRLRIRTPRKELVAGGKRVLPYLELPCLHVNRHDLAAVAFFHLWPDSLLVDHLVMLFRPMTMYDPGVKNVLDGAEFTYSMWQGYLEDETGRKVRKWLQDNDIPLQTIHTSGHASVANLRRFASALAPRWLVPIHSFETARFGEFFDNVVQQEDGVWWEV